MVACRETRQKPQDSTSQKEIADGHKSHENVFSANDEKVGPLERVPASAGTCLQLRQKDLQFIVSLSYITESCLKPSPQSTRQ